MNTQLRVTRMTEREAVKVLASSERAERWLATWKAVLEGAPRDLLSTRDGRRQVHEELTRIYHADFA